MKTQLILTSVFFSLFEMTGIAQNTCNTALSVTAGIHTVTAVDGTDIPTPLCLSGMAGTAGKWFVYTPDQDYTVTVSSDLPQNTGGDTRVHIYTGTCGNLTCYAGDDDGGDIGNGYLSYLQFNVFQGVSYYIAFDNRWNSGGFDFLLKENPYVEPQPDPVTFVEEIIPDLTGNYRIAVADMNGDYLDDVITINQNQVKIAYQQAGGGFVMDTFNVNITFPPTWSMAVGDIDRNGFNDIVLGGGQGVTFLYATDSGDGFREVSGTEYVFSQRSHFIDINNDGHLDAFVCHDIDPNVFYMNDGAGNLTFHQGGIGDHPEGGNYGSIWVDYDNDGDPDLFIAKCRGGSSTAKYNELFRNDGNGVFTNVSVEANMYDPVQTWSSAWNDFDNDGFMDALIGANSFSDGSHKLMKNNGDGTFSNVTAGSGWDTDTYSGIEYASFDFDNDGFADVIGGGNHMYMNNGDFTFDEFNCGVALGAVGDLNNDGFLDIQSGGRIYFNAGNENNWIKINLLGVASNVNGIGARVELYAGGMKQIRDVRSGMGFKYMHTLNTHFGIGTNTAIDSIIVRWPAGGYDIVHNPDINNSVLVVEGTTSLSVLKMNGGQVVIFPNPADHELTIGNIDLSQMKKMTILNMLGQTVSDFSEPVSTLDISGLNNGMYVLQIELKGGKRFADSFIKR